MFPAISKSRWHALVAARPFVHATWTLIAAFMTTAATASAQSAPAIPAAGDRIFFGDLHTHTNLSADAMLMQLAHGAQRGPEMACEYALACAQVDFYGQSDHAEMLDARSWARSVDAVKECNARGAAANPAGEPEIVAFHGFEWTSSGKGLYWGHKNVFFRNDTIPEMPFAAYSIHDLGVADVSALLKTAAIYQRIGVDFGTAIPTLKRAAFVNSLRACAADGGVSADECIRVADTPKDLWAALNGYYGIPEFRDNGYDALVIPHGTAWGMAKVGTNWAIQLNPEQHDPNLQRIIEVYSGHGNSEEYRDFDEDPPPGQTPRDAFESCNERAARLQALYCRKHDVGKDECLPRIERALREADVPFPTKPEDWGSCGQCEDCFQPAERYYPNGSVQAALARSGFAPDGSRTRYQFGFIAATDDHAGRPASVMESRALADWGLGVFFQATIDTAFAPPGRNQAEAERVSSFLYPGGLVAVHAASRSREAIWEGLKRRETYGTSGPRMSLWFHAEAPGTTATMGSRLTASKSPTFRFEVWGGPEELPGCSAATQARWGADVVRDVCLQACYNPGNRRTGIDRVEVIRIRPQTAANEALRDLIDDPFLTVKNDARQDDGTPSPTFKGEFVDPDFAATGRDTLYYIRAIQHPTPAVNGTPLHHKGDRSKPCPLYYTGPADDCLAMTEERAWSSPIYVDFSGDPAYDKKTKAPN